MMKFYSIIACCSLLLVLAVSTTHGASFEDFESYTSGQVLSGGNGGSGDWTGAWASAATVTVQPFPPANTSLGARIQGGNANIMSRDFSPSLTTTYVGLTVRPSSFESDGFISFQLSDGGTANAADTLGFGIRNVAGSPFYTRVGTFANNDDAAVGAMNDTDYRLVAKFSIDTATTFDRVDLFLDPTSNSEFDEVPIATQIGPATGLSQLDFFTVRTVLGAGDTLFIDDLVISDSFQEALQGFAVPEPASLAVWTLLGLIGVGFAMRRHRS